MQVAFVNFLCADKKPERKKLFEGGTSEAKPRQRTVEEIKAKYRKVRQKIDVYYYCLLCHLIRFLTWPFVQDNSAATSAAAAASQAKDKLLERQEKLEVLNLYAFP